MLLDALKIPSVVLVGHDGCHACVERRDDASRQIQSGLLPQRALRAARRCQRVRADAKVGHQSDFYMFEQMRPEAYGNWADAAVTISGILYRASASAPADERWSPIDPSTSLYRPAPGPLPAWAEPDYVAHSIAEFRRTGFHGGLNYYRAAETYFDLSAAFKGAKIAQPSFFISERRTG